MHSGRIELPSGQFSFNAQGDPYGIEMWSGLLSGGYESTTLGFVISNVHENTVFIDVGGASGIFTLLAASLGAQCVTVEPHPEWLALLVRNLRLNKFEDKVKVIAGAVTGSRLARARSQSIDRRILSNRVMDADTFATKSIDLFTLREVFDLNAQSNKLCVVKMDIEGAEYEVLQDPDTCQLFQSTGSILFVSFHPGFPYNKDARSKFAWLLNAAYSRFRGILDSIKVYSNLRGALTCRLPNGRPVRRRLDFVALTFFGAHDFLFDFR